MAYNVRIAERDLDQNIAAFSVALGLLAALMWGTGDFVSSTASKRIGFYSTTVYSSLLSIPLLVVLILLTGSRTQLEPTDWVLLGAASMGFLTAYLFAYRGYASGPLSVVAPIAYTSPAIATVLAVIFLGARLTPIEGGPLVAIMAGVILLSTKFSELRGAREAQDGRSVRTSGVFYGLVAAVAFSIVYVALSVVVPRVGYLMPVLVLKIGGTLGGFALSPLLNKDLRPTKLKLSLRVLLVAVFDTVGYIFLGAGIASAGTFLPFVLMTSGMGGLFLACYGMALRKEKPEANQLIGIAVSIIGVASLLYLTA